MFSFEESAWSRMLLIAIGTLLLSMPVVGIAVAPARAADTCLVLPTQADGEELVCPHA